MSIEKFGVRVANHEQSITLDGKAFANLVLFEHLRTENLRQCVAALNRASPHGENELLAEVQAHIQAMLNASSGMLQAHLGVAHAQGLRFEIVPTPGELH